MRCGRIVRRCGRLRDAMRMIVRMMVMMVVMVVVIVRTLRDRRHAM